MSSIIVKGMEMPKCCRECRIIRVDLKCYCGKTVGQKEWKSETRPDWCPLVALPDKHGRLVDADAFKVCLRNALKQTRNAYSDKGEWAEIITEQFCDAIDDQLTIVESEDES